jgi:hypothetical protein
MDRPSRRSLARALVCALILLALGAPAAARAQVTTDLVDWNLSETTSTWGGGTQFHISSGGSGTASYRWLDSPNKTTVISANGCSDNSPLGGATIGVGNTGYNGLFSAPVGWCFVLRGRTAAGSGSMVNHDGRILR